MRALRLGMLLLLFAGCDIFSTRTPDPPTSGSTFIWTPATTVGILIENFVGTLNQMDAYNYGRVFISPTDSAGGGTKTFLFSPTPGLDQSSRSVFLAWTAESERAWVSKLHSLLAPNSKLSVILSNSKTDQSSTPATFSADYTISIPSTNTSGLPGVVQGSLQMQMILVTSNEWRITSWSDFPQQNSTSSTWTDLKVKLSQ